ncbi:MAG TPA: SUF system Fe-S cluster assembly regulator [Stellaceae bacterium]|jgi:FeS assembly SUF system regulator|nr:SUF system Fe-S cluster assembly regulator [Stellaceae bacterium]
MVILSKLADYGVIIATHLAAHPERQMTAAVLAHETSLPRATVAKILKILAHAGVVAGARGAAGGYRLARDGSAISVVQVVAAIDGSVGVTQCTIHDDCKRSHFCATRPHWHRINAAVSTALGAITLAEMANPFGVPPARPAPASQPTAAP